MNCKHRNTETRWHLDDVRCVPTSPPVYVELLRCVDCEELVGMGPAAPSCSAEVTAAAFAAATESGGFGSDAPCGGAFLQGWEGRAGWEHVESWQAGLLARCIADHDELQGTSDL